MAMWLSGGSLNGPPLEQIFNVRPILRFHDDWPCRAEAGRRAPAQVVVAEQRSGALTSPSQVHGTIDALSIFFVQREGLTSIDESETAQRTSEEAVRAAVAHAKCSAAIAAAGWQGGKGCDGRWPPSGRPRRE